MTLDPIEGKCVQGSQFRVLGSEARILECAGTTVLWNDATCRRSPNFSDKNRVGIGLNWVRFHFLKKSKLVKSSMFERGFVFFELSSFSRLCVFKKGAVGHRGADPP